MDIATAPAATAQAQAVEAEEPVASALDATDEAIFLMGAVRDAAGRIVDFEYRYCNRAALALLGRARDEVLGQRLLQLFPSHSTNGLFEAYGRVAETGEPLRHELSFDEGGVTGEFEIIVSKAGDGYVLAGHDISDRKHLDRQGALLSDQLQLALTTRIGIEQAKGYVAASYGTDPATAFQLIRRYARDHNLKLHEVCQSVLRGDEPDFVQIPALRSEAG